MKEQAPQKPFVQLFEYVIEHIFDILTISLAAYVVIRNQFQPYNADDIITLLNILIAILALVASSSLWHRGKYMHELTKTTARTYELLAKRFDLKPSSDMFFQSKPELKNYIESANKICLCGVNLTTTIHENLISIQAAINKGNEVNILIIDPDSSALEVAGRRTNTGQPNYYVTKLATTLQLLDYVYKTSNKARHKLHVRLLPYPPSFGILGFDIEAETDKSVVFIEIYPHKIKDKSPQFELTPNKDRQWYGYFSDQFSKMWNEARLWQPPPQTTK